MTSLLLQQTAIALIGELIIDRLRETTASQTCRHQRSFTQSFQSANSRTKQHTHTHTHTHANNNKQQTDVWTDDIDIRGHFQLIDKYRRLLRSTPRHKCQATASVIW